MNNPSVKTSSQVKQRVGIYSGTFDPIHAGHIAFALQSASQARLDMVLMLPERNPRSKRYVTHYAHRTAMIKRAIRPYRRFEMFETEDKTFSVIRTLPRIKKRYPDATLVYLCGSDVLKHMGEWPHIDQFLGGIELCVGRRHNQSNDEVDRLIASLPVSVRASTIIETYASAVSSSKIRDAMSRRHSIHGLLESVKAYASKEWLYL